MLEFQRRHIARQLLTRGPLMVAPFFVNAAALITFTMALRHLSTPPTPFSSETFLLSDCSLAQTDPFGVLPGTIGAVAMLNTEIRRALAPTPTSEDTSGTLRRFSSIIDSLARGFSVVIAVLAMTNPVVSCELPRICPRSRSFASPRRQFRYIGSPHLCLPHSRAF